MLGPARSDSDGLNLNLRGGIGNVKLVALAGGEKEAEAGASMDMWSGQSHVRIEPNTFVQVLPLRKWLMLQKKTSVKRHDLGGCYLLVYASFHILDWAEKGGKGSSARSYVLLHEL